MHEITTNLTRNKANKTLMGIHNLTTYWDFCMLKTNFWFLKFFLKVCVLLKQKKKKKKNTLGGNTNHRQSQGGKLSPNLPKNPLIYDF